MSEHWTAEELREYQRTGREPVRPRLGLSDGPTRKAQEPVRPRLGLSDGPMRKAREIEESAAAMQAAGENFVKKLCEGGDWPYLLAAERRKKDQEEIERRYAEAEARGEVYAMDITEDPDGRVSMRPAGRVLVDTVDRVPPVAEKKKRRKYGNEPTYIGWKRFDSKKEARFYQELMLRVKAGELWFVIRQVPFDLAEKEKLQYVADFVAVKRDGTLEAVYDVKSEATRKSDKYVIKKKLMNELWGITITEV